MKSVYLSLFIGLILLACQDGPLESSVYIGGEIINPKSNVVVLMKKEHVVDSIFLEEDNTFGARIPIEKGDLYYFHHGNEFQYLFLEPKDSIRLRLNTWDFDETLVFGGTGSQKNELLLDLFLINEKELKNFYSYFELSEAAFQEKIDERRLRHSELLSSIKNSDIYLSNKYLHLAQAAIDYPLYHLKEIYPFYNKKLLKLEKPIKVSAEFYSYRKDIDLNDAFLSEYYAYQNFVTAHLYNIALQKNKGELSDETFYIFLLESIVGKIENTELKNRLLNQEINNLIFNKPSLFNISHLDLFYENCSDSTAIKNVKQLLADKTKLPKNSDFPNFEVISTSDKKLSVLSLFKNKPVVLYFWADDKISNEYLSKRINFLHKEYPEISFIGINTDASKSCSSHLSQKLDNQYYLSDTSKGNELVSNKYPRAVLINANGKITNSFALLSSHYIEKELIRLNTN